MVRMRTGDSPSGVPNPVLSVILTCPRMVHGPGAHDICAMSVCGPVFAASDRQPAPPVRGRQEDWSAPGPAAAVLHAAGLGSSTLTAEGASIPLQEVVIRVIAMACPSPDAPSARMPTSHPRPSLTPAATATGRGVVHRMAGAAGIGAFYRSTGTPTRLPYSVQEPS